MCKYNFFSFRLDTSEVERLIELWDTLYKWVIGPKNFLFANRKKVNFLLETTFSLEEMRAEVDVLMKDASKQTNYI